MKTYIFYACAFEQLVRYTCESIWNADENIESVSTESLLEQCGVTAFADSDPALWGKTYFGRKIISPQELQNCQFDKVYISSFTHVDTIYKALINEYGIPAKKVERHHIDLINRTRARFVHHIAQFAHKRGIAGNVAEGGVYRGDFSRVINAAFPDRKLYLFDTFNGFDSRDFTTDTTFSKEFVSRESKYSNLADTSINLVMSKLPYPNQAIIKRGFFPETAEGVDDCFVFVNLDFDLYAPIKAGLEFFYPRMVKGGVILIHDYFCSSFEANKAVDEFCIKNDLYAISIGDIFSVAIIKQE